MKVLCLGVLEAADLMGYVRDTLYKRIRRGELPVIRVGRRLFVTVDAVRRETGLSVDHITRCALERGYRVYELEV